MIATAKSALQDKGQAQGGGDIEECTHIIANSPTMPDGLEAILMEKGLLEQVQKLPIVIEVNEPITEDPLKKIHHSVVFPYGYDIPKDPGDVTYVCEPPAELPVKFPYELDPFQRRAIGALHIGHSVLVAAHTSAGKTTIAEYIIAAALARNQRVVYTTPIKALSNQKYQDLKLAAYTKGSVGIMTGDTTLNRTASVLVMTTEILRNMLHQGAELLREIGYVIFDEVHYMRNSERGLVWEDCIAMLSSNIQFCFLSATVPNATEFAGWVASLHSIPVHVVYTQYRPVPLMHFLCPVGGDGIYPICSSIDQNKVRYDQVIKAKANLPHDNAQAVARGEEEGTSGVANRKQQQKAVRDTLHKVMKNLITRDCFPLIVFAFGKKKCEMYAMDFISDYFHGSQRGGSSQAAASVTHGEEPKDLGNVAAKKGQVQTPPQITQNLVTPEQTRAIETIFDAALKCLPEEDRKLKPIISLRSMLRRGIAVHHSGLLPWAKEIIEILFIEGLVKILYATETFAMGLNLPARAIIFSEFKKFDGLTSRLVTSGEYVQMAGRAGRRGIDKQGMSICIFNTAEECDNIVKVIQGTTEPLNSAYRLSFNSVLNLMQIDDTSPEHVIKRSFLQFQQLFRLPRCVKKIVTLGQANQEDQVQFTTLLCNVFTILARIYSSTTHLRDAFTPQMAEALQELGSKDGKQIYSILKEYLSICALKADLYMERSKYISQDSLKHILSFGRLVNVCADGLDFGWVPVVRTQNLGCDVFVDCLVPCLRTSVPQGYTTPSDRSLVFFNEGSSNAVQSLDIDLAETCKLLMGKPYYSNFAPKDTDNADADANVIDADIKVKLAAGGGDKEPAVKKGASSKASSKQNTVPTQKVSHADINDLIYANDATDAVGLHNIYEYSFIDALQPFVRDNKASYQMLAPCDVLECVLRARSKEASASKGKGNKSKLNEALRTEVEEVACVIVRVSVKAVRRVSAKILQNIPDQLYQYDDKKTIIFFYYKMVVAILASKESETDPVTLSTLMEPHIDFAKLVYSNSTGQYSEIDRKLRVVEYSLENDTNYGVLSRLFTSPAYVAPSLHRVLNALCVPEVYSKISVVYSSDDSSANKRLQEAAQNAAFNMVVRYMADDTQNNGIGGQVDITGSVLAHVLTCIKRDVKQRVFQRYIKEADELILSNELEKMKNFLLREKFIEKISEIIEDCILTEKGKVACHVSSANEIILVECLFEVQFTDLTPRVLAGVLASLLGEGTGTTKNKQLQMDAKLRNALDRLKSIVSSLLRDCATEDTTLELRCTTVEHIVDDAMAVIAYSWAAGQTFQEILEIDSTQFEGSIVRMFRRLINLIDQLLLAAQVIGDDRLQARLTAVREAVFRDIIKVNSLYVVTEDVT